MSLLSRLPRAIVWSLCGLGTLCLAADGPRIVRLANAPARQAAEPIREPMAGSALELPPTAGRQPVEVQSPVNTQRRSEFVPVSLPDPSPPLTSGSVSELSARPPLEAPQVAQRELLQPTVSDPPTSTGPLLSSPIAAPAPAVEHPAATTLQPQPAVVTPQVTTLPTQSERRSTWEPAAPAPASNSAATQAQAQRAIGVVAQRAMQKAEQANSLAQRGMLYSARAELVQALQLITHALDAESASPAHATALSAGLAAIEEARDFATHSSGPADATQVRAVAEGHRTKAFIEGEQVPTSPVAAQQAYMSLAQGQFIAAAGQVPAASQILYRLGRLETAMAAHDADPLALHGPQAIVFHQAALATDGGNWLAMNELGVLYARYGQLESAKQLLLSSVRVHPHVEGWQNLAAIHHRLGEADLAKRADSERQLLASKQGASATSQTAPIQWVDTKTFAATSGSQDGKWPAEVARKNGGK